MEFFLESTGAEDEIEGETMGRFLVASREGRSYIVPMKYAPDKKQTATYIRGFLRLSVSSKDPHSVSTHLLVQTTTVVHVVTTRIPTLDYFHRHTDWDYSATGSS
jgi:hypothetical protein